MVRNGTCLKCDTCGLNERVFVIFALVSDPPGLTPLTQGGGIDVQHSIHYYPCLLSDL